MKTFKINRFAFLFIVLSVGCSYEFPEPPEDTVGQLENADLSKPVFIGGTLFSGVHSGALTSEFAKYSLPQIFLNHLEGNAVGSWQDFSPTVESENGFNIFENELFSESIGQYDLVYPTSDTAFFKRVTTEGEAFSYSNAGSEISNFSFPKSQILDITEANSSNPFVASFNLASATVLDAALSQDPSFFVLNLGYEDILSYALTGAEANASINDVNSFSAGDMPSEALFESKLNEVVDAFLQSNPDAKGAIFNIPDLLKLPYFIEVGFDITPFIQGTPTYSVALTREAQYNSALDQYYAQNPGIPFEDRRPYLDFAGDRAFNWGILVTDEDLPEAYYPSGQPIPKVRHMTRDERVFYSVENFLSRSRGFAPANALSEREYLKVADLELITNKILAYNDIIADRVAQSNGRLALVDVHAFYEVLYDGLSLLLNRRPNGIDIEGVNFYPGISKFGIFSADGLNLNPRGNALLSTVLEEAIENTFGGTLKNIDPNAFRGTPIRTATADN